MLAAAPRECEAVARLRSRSFRHRAELRDVRGDPVARRQNPCVRGASWFGDGHGLEPHDGTTRTARSTRPALQTGFLSRRTLRELRGAPEGFSRAVRVEDEDGGVSHVVSESAHPLGGQRALGGSNVGDRRVHLAAGLEHGRDDGGGGVARDADRRVRGGDVSDPVGAQRGARGVVADDADEQRRRRARRSQARDALGDVPPDPAGGLANDAGVDDPRMSARDASGRAWMSRIIPPTTTARAREAERRVAVGDPPPEVADARRARRRTAAARREDAGAGAGGATTPASPSPRGARTPRMCPPGGGGRQARWTRARVVRR